MENKKFKTEYWFQESYYRHGDMSKQNTTVCLTIDYINKRFDIKPMYGDSFKFKDNSQNWAMWQAVMKCMKAALDFATSELGFTPKISSPEQ